MSSPDVAAHLHSETLQLLRQIIGDTRGVEGGAVTASQPPLKQLVLILIERKGYPRLF